MLPKIVAITLITSTVHLLSYFMKTIFIYLSNLQIQPRLVANKLINKINSLLQLLIHSCLLV